MVLHEHFSGRKLKVLPVHFVAASNKKGYKSDEWLLSIYRTVSERRLNAAAANEHEHLRFPDSDVLAPGNGGG